MQFLPAQQQMERGYLFWLGRIHMNQVQLRILLALMIIMATNPGHLLYPARRLPA